MFYSASDQAGEYVLRLLMHPVAFLCMPISSWRILIHLCMLDPVACLSMMMYSCAPAAYWCILWRWTAMLPGLIEATTCRNNADILWIHSCSHPLLLFQCACTCSYSYFYSSVMSTPTTIHVFFYFYYNALHSIWFFYSSITDSLLHLLHDAPLTLCYSCCWILLVHYSAPGSLICISL